MTNIINGFDINQDLFSVLFTLDSLIDRVFTVADIAVDTLGRAWTFMGPNYFETENLNIYNDEGLLFSYPSSFSTASAYGTVFIDNQLYIGFGIQSPNYQYSIVPVLIDGDSARLGIPIPFVEENFADLASCQVLDCTTNTFNLVDYETIKVFPNPANEEINIESTEEIIEANFFSINGAYIKMVKNSNTINIRNLDRGIYVLMVQTPSGIFRERVLKH